MINDIKNRKPLIDVFGLTKQFKAGSGTITVLDNVSFTIPDGSFTIIYGPSGSGKSTLLHALMGIDPPTNGKVTYGGKNLYTLNATERAYFRANTMGVVQQEAYWIKSLSVLENVALPMRFLGVSNDAALEAARQSLDKLGMKAFSGKRPSRLSGGEQQRVAMARALVNNPAYIVADEPTGNLDSKNGDELIKLLVYLNKKFLRTVVLVTHNIEYLPIADQILYIQDGKVEGVKGAAAKKMTDDIVAETKQRAKQWGES